LDVFLRIKTVENPCQYAFRLAKCHRRAILRAMTREFHSRRGAWVDRFFESYFRRRPVDATFVGVRGHDRALPDLSTEGLLRQEQEMLAQLRAWEAMEEQESSGESGGTSVSERFERLDARLAAGQLRIELWERGSRWQLGNPSMHVGEAVFGLMSLLLPGSAPAEGVREALLARLDAVGPYLAQARGHLESVPVGWTERALSECRGALRFLREGLPVAPVAREGSTDAGRGARTDEELLGAASEAADAVEGYARFLEREVLGRPSGRVGCGADAFALHVKEGHFLERAPDEIASYARDEIERTRSWLVEAAPELGAATPEEVLARLPDTHPTADTYLARYEETWRAMQELALERRLITWPDFPIRYVPRPAWSRAAAPDLYFLFYRSPAAFGRPPVHDYLVAPLPEDASPNEREAFLRAQNDSVIKLNHVVHHGGIGHHVQNWHAFRSPLRVGRVAAVDGACRIGMLCGGTMAEGWACYATDLMAEAGGLTPEEVYAEHHGRIRMAARAVVDVELHHGRMSLDEASRYYVETAGMSATAGRAEAVKNSMFPGAALMYLVGTDLIHELRAELMATLGDRFTLRTFHDAFLSYGSIPVRLVADQMRLRAARAEPLDAHSGLQPATP
jgi:uncharacterized protein (DUF885 family)